MAVLNNARHETFVQELAKGVSQRKAYRAAYPKSENWKDATVDAKACNLAKDDKILARYKELKDIAANAAGGAVMTRNEKRTMLAAMARDTELSAADRQRAIDLDNKMEDEYTSDRSRDEQQARIEKIKAETSRIKGEAPGEDEQDDGFMEALRNEVDSVWGE